MFVKAFVAQPSVEGLDVRILVRLARFDQTQGNSLFVSQDHHRLTAKLLAIDCPDHSGQAALHGQPVLYPGHALPGYCPLHFDGHSLVGGVVDDRQAPYRPAFRGTVEHEVHRPHLIGSERPQEGLALAYRHLLTLSASHLQARFLIQPLHSLVVNDKSLLPQLQMDHAHPVASVPVRQRSDLLAQLNVVVGPKLLAQRASAHPHRRQRSPLAQPLLDRARHQQPAGQCGHHFFAPHP